MIKLDDIIRASKIHHSRIHNVYIFGSRVYGNYNSLSDWDVIMVANNSVECVEIVEGNINVHVYTPDRFQKDLDWHRVNNIECIYAPPWAILRENIDYVTTFEISIPKIRHAISHISSNSWVKAKKKIQKGDTKIGLKSLFHSIRIPIFAKQVLDKGYIDFQSANKIWYNILKTEQSWDKLYNDFKPLHNKALSDFRKSAPK